VPGARLYYRALGEGVPIVVVHGGPGMDHTYLLPGFVPLSERYRLILYDQRGGGRSEGVIDSSTVSFDQFVEDIDAIGDSLKLGRFVLLGHSWGGLVAIRYAARHPERLRSLVLMNSVEPGRRYASQSAQLFRAKQTPDDSAEIARIARSDAMRQRDTAAVNAMLRLTFRATFADRSLAKNLSINLDPRTARNMSPIATLVMGSLGRNFDLWGEAATVRVPTLIVQGAADAMPLDMVRELARTIPTAELQIVNGAGHFPYIERPAETFAGISEFINRHR
jgi:proline iminopeptidase